MLVRIVQSAAAFLLVAWRFRRVHSWWALLAVPVSALVGLAVAAPSAAYSASVRSDTYLAILMRLGVLPMSLFSGVFFPIESLPVVLRWVAYVLPLWHAVDLSRAAMIGGRPACRGCSACGTCSICWPGAWSAAGWRTAAFIAGWCSDVNSGLT